LPKTKKNKRNVYNISNGLSLSTIQPRTENQKLAFDDWYDGYHLMLHGSAGTGKSFISLYLALSDKEDLAQYHKVYIVRSAVPTRDIGYLPGKESEKIAMYEQPYISICSELYNRGDAYNILKHNKEIEFISTSFIRGNTIDNAIVVVDEVNNMSFHELDTIITRVGDNCRIIFSGDFKQSDLRDKREKQGLKQFMGILNNMSQFSHIEFNEDDIVRSQLVKDYIVERERQDICT
jgi:predicted ribonuclease YlaK